MSTILTVMIGADPPPRLDKALARFVPEAAALSRTRLARLIAEGYVCRGDVPLTDAKARVSEGDAFVITVPGAEEVETLAEAIPLDILHEDADLIVVNKPAGMVVHPAPGTPSGTLVNALLAHCGDDLSGVGGEKRPGIVHRIDKDTSGILVVAKSDRAHHGLAEQFEKHSAQRSYLAICHGTPDPGDPRINGIAGVSWEPGATLKIQARLARHKTDRQRQAVTRTAGRHAVTRARLAERLGPASLLECRLETGRTHQIRVHMAHVGHALLGDPVYGGRRKISLKGYDEAAAATIRDFPRQALHAASLGFCHPVSGAQLSFEAALPADMQSLLAALRSGA